MTLLLDRPAINVWHDGDRFSCRFGDLGARIDSASHHHGQGRKRPCLHLKTAPPPHLLLFGTEAVRALTRYPYAYTGRHWPAILSRIGDIVVVGFDRLGDPRFCRDGAEGPPQLQWRYQLWPVVFEGDEEPHPKCVLGRWPD